jgi:hypothetical protein
MAGSGNYINDMDQSDSEEDLYAQAGEEDYSSDEGEHTYQDDNDEDEERDDNDEAEEVVLSETREENDGGYLLQDGDEDEDDVEEDHTSISSPHITQPVAASAAKYIPPSLRRRLVRGVVFCV